MKTTNKIRAAELTIRRGLLTSGSVLVMLGTLAFAPDARAADSAASAQPSNGSTNVEEVTVTARKKEEKLMDVPVAATVLTAATINRYDTTDLINIASIAPGIQVTRTGGGTPGGAIYIRGIGIFGPDYASEQPVALVIDGMPITRGHFVDTGFFDQSDVQILKGPQSLFYGKNSPAGVVAINSASPTPGAPMQGYFKASYGIATEDPQIEGALSFPIGDTLAVRFAVRAEDMQGGYITDIARPIASNPVADPWPGVMGGQLAGANFDKYPKTKELIERLTTVWKPTSNFDATLKVLGSYYHDDASFGSQGIAGPCLGTAALPSSGNPIYAAALGGAWIDPYYKCGPNNRTTDDGTPPQQILQNFLGAPGDGKYYTLTQIFQTTFQMNYHLPWATLTSVTGYYHLNASEFDNYDNTTYAETPDKQDENTHVFTQEIRLATNFNGPVNFTGGGFFEHERRYLWNSNRILLLGPLPAGLTNQSQYAGISNSMIGYDDNYAEDFSFFGQVSWKILPNLELTGGGRWTDGHKETTEDQLMQAIDQLFGPYAVAQQFSPFTPAGTIYYVTNKYQNFSPEATLAWHPTRNVMLYTAYKTGFLAGGIANPGVVTNYLALKGVLLSPQQAAANAQSNLTFGPEKVKGFEAGVKGTFFDGRLSGDLTVFDYTYYGLQVTTFHTDTTTFSIGNAGSAIDKGVELNTNFEITPELVARASFTYVPLRYSSYHNSPCNVTQTPGVGACQYDPKTGAPEQNLSGQRFGSPATTVNFGATWTHELNQKYSMQINGDLVWFSATPLIADQPYTSTPSHGEVNATMKVFQTEGPWSASIIGTNLNGDSTIEIAGPKPLGATSDIGGTIPPGREVRLQVEYKF
jgi:outer membrane receptor protein involved in Fe transport